MGRIWVRELTGGLDTRRMAATTSGGVLIKGEDGHINSGGEFEKRPAFVPSFTLPAGTVALARNATGLLVFGHTAAPSGIPSGVTYQRLQHPSTSSLALTRVLSYDLYGAKVYAVGQFADGSVHHYYDGTNVTDWFDGRARAAFRVAGGDASSDLTSLMVNGVSIISGTIGWATSNEATAAAIAADINTTVTVPNYDATAVGETVNIIAEDSGAGPNGFVVSIATATGFVVDPISGISMAGGVTSAAFVPGGFVRTIGSKVYSVSDGVLHFSGIRAPTKWTTDAAGAGFIDMSQETSDAEDLTAVANYQGFVAVFAPRVVLIYYVDPDPDLNAKRQILKNTGTRYPRSVTEFGDSDLFYLSDSGQRSLKARDSSNAAATTDIGSPIDKLVRAKLRTMNATQRDRIVSLINPEDGRYWLIMGDTAYVFSFFPQPQVSAWTTYKLGTTTGTTFTGFEAEDAVVLGDKVYVRSGNTIYSFGGLGDELTYDATVAKAHLPFLGADKPTEFKGWNGFDCAVEGVWSVYVAAVVQDPTIRELAANVTGVTFDEHAYPLMGMSTHVSLQFESQGTGPAKVSSALLHYVGGEDK